MTDHIERISPELSIPPSWRRKEEEERPPAARGTEEEQPEEGEKTVGEERPLGHAAPDETGNNLDVTA